MSLISFRSAAVLTALIFSLLFSGCTSKKTGKQNQNPEYNPEISAFTSGVIPAQSYIKVRLSSDFPGEINTQDPIQIQMFDFSPRIKGKAYWIDQRTIEFRPEQDMPSGTDYSVKFRLTKLFPSKKNIKDFEFAYSIIPMQVSVEFTGFKTQSKTDLSWNEISGKVLTSDEVSPAVVEEIISVLQSNRKLPINWEHNPAGTIHEFVIDSVNRTEKTEFVELSWDARTLGIKEKGSSQYEVPSLGDFKLLESKVIQLPEQYVQLTFSDPVKSDQNLSGLISLNNDVNLRFTVEDNLVRVYPEIKQSGKVEINILPGIKNILGFGYKTPTTVSLEFDELKPAVRLIGQGVIMPQSSGLTFPFEAVNLKAVNVKIVKIYEDNIGQFLQVNDLNGNYELRRAGRLVAKKTINLISDRAINYGEWNAFAIDLSSLINTEPGAIYHVELSFQQKFSLYPCDSTSQAEDPNLTENNEEFVINENDISYWDATSGYYSYDDYYGYEEYDYYYYDWDQRDNPCSPSYYNESKKVSRNILASNLGIIAKSANNKSMTFAVTDLLTTSPLSGVTIELYNFQHKLINSASTNSEGFAELILQDRPFLLIAKKDEQRGYLKLVEGASLSLSQFDVSGNAYERGIKGFIYGERGVWRPGDSLFLNFILEDKEKILPQNHPVNFELYDARGKIYKKSTLTENLNGFYSFKAGTRQDDPTGNWRLDVKVGGLTFSSRVRIETVKPNRLKIKLDFPLAELSSDENKNNAKLQVNWLTGPPAKNLQAKVSVSLSNIETSFKGYENYIFTDPAKTFSPSEKEIFDGYLNETGETSFTPEFYVSGNSPGKLRATFTTRCFEEGGDFSIDQFSMTYSPYKKYIGLKVPKGDGSEVLYTDTLQNFEIVCVDEEGKVTDIKGLEINIYKLDWRWWWYSSGEDLGSYTGTTYNQPVFHKVTDSKNGKAGFSFRINNPDWGRFLVRVNDPNGQHSAGKIIYMDWPGWMSRNSGRDAQSASILILSSDKTKYNVGETATVSVPASQSGRILVSIENGTKVINRFWQEVSGNDAVIKIPITAEMAPNAYVNVSLIQPHGQTKNDLPIRMYGLIPIFVENPETHLNPQISMSEVLRPESVAEIKISEKDKKQMTYTLAIVDEGLLDLTRFKTPDAWQYFYAKEALGVKTFDVYDWVIGAYGGRIDGVFSIGGDEEVIGNSKNKANRFVPMVKVLGPFVLEKGKTNSHKIKIPNYIGSVRVMVVAGNNDGAYGKEEKTCPVRKPLMILSTLPRVLGPDETVNIPVTVFAMEPQVKKVTIKLETNDFFDAEETEKTVNFTSPGDMLVSFKARVKSKTGIGKVKFTARSGNEEATEDVELDVRFSNPEVTVQYLGFLNQGEKWEKQFSLPGVPGSNRASLEVSSMPPLNFGRRLNYLLNYPYGCLEQTTSAVFPQLYLSDIMVLEESQKTVIETNIQAGIQKILKSQLPNGGLGLWPTSTSPDDWGTSFAGHFMIDAQKKGYSVSSDWVKKWINYQKKTARSWTGKKYESLWQQKSLELSQSYRLYTLALAGEAELAPMNRLREKPDLDISAKWQLAAAYALAGQTKIAAEMVKNLTTEIPVYTDNYTYGSELRDKGFVLQTLTLLNRKEEGIPVVQYISDKLSGESWYSTQTTSVCLMAVSQFIGAGNVTKDLNYDFSLNGGEKKHAASNSAYSQIPVKYDKQDNGKVMVENKGKGVLFIRLSIHGTPPPGEEKNIAQNLKLTVEYTDLNGNSVDVKKLPQGTDFMAVVTAYNPGTMGYYGNMALSTIFPSGWEIQNIRLFESNLGTFDQPVYQDFRDDRVYTFFDLNQRSSKKFAFKLTAAYQGRFYMPGILCEEMYHGDIRAVEAGGWVEVVENIR